MSACFIASSAGQTGSTGAAFVVLNSQKEFDLNGDYSTTVGNFTAPYGGIYEMWANLSLASHTACDYTLTIDNATAGGDGLQAINQLGATGICSVNVNGLVEADKGDSIRCRLLCSTGANPVIDADVSKFGGCLVIKK